MAIDSKPSCTRVALAAVSAALSCFACGGDVTGKHQDLTGKPREDAGVAVGEPCIPEAEYDPGFAGLDGENFIGGSDPACASKLCVGYQFVGRVSCPEGQAAGAGVCETPHSDEHPTVAVTASVLPQDPTRPSELAVVCSCHCAGGDDTALCKCPAGMACTPLVPDLGGQSAGVPSGSYCVKTELLAR